MVVLSLLLLLERVLLKFDVCSILLGLLFGCICCGGVILDIIRLVCELVVIWKWLFAICIFW